MKTILNVVTALAAIVLAIWLIGNITATSAMKRAGNEPWPAGLGTLASVETRVRPHKTNDDARRLMAVAAPLGISFDKSAKQPTDPVRTAIGEYVKAEHLRPEPAISAPPAAVVAYLAAHEVEIDALRDHLLQAKSIAWELDPAKGLEAPTPNLLAYMHISRLLTARALERGRATDVRAWDDLHAAWRLAQSLEPRPEMITQLILLAIARSINAAAWKLLPANATWFAEVQKIDHRRLLLLSYQHDAWLMWRHAEGSLEGGMAMVGRPYVRWGMVGLARHQRATAHELAAVTACRFDGEAFSQARLDAIPRWNVMARIAMPNFGAAWQRTFRAMAEREATANAMRISQGQPIVTKSACTDGTWSYDGARLTFSRELPKSSPHENVMPLSLAIPARATRRST